MVPRSYQQRTLDALYHWWVEHPGETQIPLIVAPTGSGKSVIIAELTRLLFDTWPEAHPRTLVLVPSRELAEQNADKLMRRLPSHIRIGYYSASLGRKMPDADVIVATIGSVYNDAHLLGNIKAVIIDEAHMVNPDGKEAGRYRKLLTSLARTCTFRAVGLTATPFRGNGVWLTDGEDPLFTGLASTITVRELLDAGYLAPLVRPKDVLATRIDTSDIKTTSGDYNLGDLAERVDTYLPAAAAEAAAIAADRNKWIAFLPTVAGAQHFVDCLGAVGIHAALVCGETPAKERAALIADFRAGRVRCLVTVLALATGFDVPDVDCILWLRPTISPVLYVQGAGRGLRIAEGKTDCLWLDFSDTTERMGPVDTIKGRKRRAKREDALAPHKICDNCGERCGTKALECPSCGHVFPVVEDEMESRRASNAAIMAHQIEPKIVTYPVDRVDYGIHHKEGKPDSLRVDYYSGLRRVATEWVCFEHGGFARAKAEAWWEKRSRTGVGNYCHRKAGFDTSIPRTSYEAMTAAINHSSHIDGGSHSCSTYFFAVPHAIRVNETGKYPEIIGFIWEPLKEAA